MHIPKPSLSYLLYLLLGSFAIIWGIVTLYPIELFEYRLVEQSITNWNLAPFASRIFIGTLFFIGSSLILNTNPKNKIIFIYIVCLTISFFDLIWGVINSSAIIKESYGSLYDSNTFVSFFPQVIMLFFCIFLMCKKLNTDYSFQWLKYVLSIICIALPFILNPIYPKNFSDQSEPINNTISIDSLEVSSNQSKNGNAIFAFFSTSCPYCILAAKKMKVAQKTYSTFPKVHLFFIGSEEGVTSFFEESNTHFNYSIPNQKKFLNIAGYSFPSFIFTENGTPTKRFTGGTFNFHAMSKFSSK